LATNGLGCHFPSAFIFIATTHSRTGTTQYTAYTESGNLLTVTDPGSRTTTFTYNNMGRRITTDAPDTAIQGGTSSNITHTSYTPRGEIRATWGDQVNPSFRVYDEQGRLIALHTWRAAPTLTQSTTTPPTGSDTTTWQYHATRGWLVRKLDHDSKGPLYTYTAAGRVRTRTWERGAHTRYDYRRGILVAQRHFTNSAADTGANAGNDPDTPDIGFTYDAFGRSVGALTSATATHTGIYLVNNHNSSGKKRTPIINNF